MKYRIRGLTLTICVTLLLGWASIDKALAERKITLTQKQADYKLTKETTKKYLNISGDKYDAFRDVNISGRAGFPIEILISPDGSGEFIERSGSRALPVTFECDYEKGETRGELTFSYKDPRNLYGRIHAVVEANCIPLSSQEQTAQIEAEKESTRIAEERRVIKLQAQAQREAEKNENKRLVAERERARQVEEAREEATRNSPQFKRNEAQDSIRRLRQQIELAQKSISEERRVGVVSGYVNATKLHELGSFVIAAENEIQRHWQIYKKNGGQATSLSEIK